MISKVDKIGLMVTGLIMSGIVFKTSLDSKERSAVAEQASKAKTEIKLKDYNRYVRNLEYCDNLENFDSGVMASRRPEIEQSRNTYWIKDAKRMNDSLRIDSIARTAYSKGLNAVKNGIRAVK